jgi:subtilase family serine protease
LGLRQRRALSNLLRDLYDPGSPDFHHYLTPEQFSEKFGPTEADYQKVLKFAEANGLQVVGTYPHRQLVDVSGTVSAIEKAFHVNMLLYDHPKEKRQFFAPDVEATVDTNVPIENISGLNNYMMSHPGAHQQSERGDGDKTTGTGPKNNLWGYDFRHAFAPDVNLTGTGQNIGLVEMDGYYTKDITNYEVQSGLPDVNISNVKLTGSSGYPDNNTNDVGECSLDIEMTICMAPGMSRLYVFESDNFDTVLASMVASNQIKQFSSSWFGYGFDSSGDGLLQEMTAQGQTFFQASGDGDAYLGAIAVPADDWYVTSVGGTTLTLDSTGTTYVSESVWNWSNQGVSNGWCCNPNKVANTYWGSGGGVSTVNPIPPWQQSVDMTAVGGSSKMRNLPDVALVANNVEVYYFNGLAAGFGGTSCAAPLWAGFIALVNEQASGAGLPPVGFLTPAFYSIGQSDIYNYAFHDTTNGNDFSADGPSKYNSAVGYDLCTGWGTPTGQTMIDTLVGYAGPIWVNFSATACPGTGTYTNPFCTLASGTNAVASGGTICLVGPNSSGVKPTITKPMTLRAFYGPVTIGN